jgi:transcriptional regulator with XRE-family HTH domain
MTHCSRRKAVSDSPTMAGVQSQAHRIKALREQHGLSQREFAKRAKVGKSTIAMVEMGQRGIGVDTAQRIARFASVSPLWLLWGEGEE